MLGTSSKLKSQANNDTLIYIGDPMCSWCYGFAPELDKILAAFPNVPLEIVVGGLRVNGDESMMELHDFLTDHWREVHDASGQDFNYAILKQSIVLYNTEPACRAVYVMGQMAPEKKYTYFKLVQRGFYYHNYLPHDAENYAKLAAECGVDYEQFLNKFESRQAKVEVFSDFDLAQKLGATGFPTLIAQIDGKLYLVTQGYQKAEKIIALLKSKDL